MQKRILFSLFVAVAATAWTSAWASVVPGFDGTPWENAYCPVAKTTTSATCRYPVYNTKDDPASGIKEWRDTTVTAWVMIDQYANSDIRTNAVTNGYVTSWYSGWYVVQENTSINQYNVYCDGSNPVHLILADGATLNLSATAMNFAGLNTSSGSIIIYGSGTLTATAYSGTGGAGIGGHYGAFGGNVTINGGTITATGSQNGAGIGGGGSTSTSSAGGSGHDIIINGGTVTATGGNHITAAGIGGGGGYTSNDAGGSGHDIIINGGKVIATSSNSAAGGGAGSGAGIGGGKENYGKDITINGGTIIANGGLGAGIGGGYKSYGDAITINGGKITTIGGNSVGLGYGAGIGGGGSGNGSNIIINGGKVTATGGAASTIGGAGIGGGYKGYGSNIAINGGFVTATGGVANADGIGNGTSGTGSSGIVVQDTVNVMAGTSNPPTTPIHANGQGTKNITSSIAGQNPNLRYVVTDMALTFSDNMSTNEITDYVNVTTDVTIGRTFYKDGKNNTICLPFSLSAEKLAASPLAGYNKLQEFESAVIENEGEESETLTLTMKDATAIEAGKPYIIVWPNTSSTIVNPKFEDVTITTDAGSSSAKVNGVTFCGTMMPYAVTANDKGIMFVGASGECNWPNVGGNIRGFRSYFTVDLSANSPLRRGMAAMLSDGRTSPTAIEEAEIEAKVAKLIESGRVVIISNGVKYDLNGRIIE